MATSTTGREEKAEDPKDRLQEVACHPKTVYIRELYWVRNREAVLNGLTGLAVRPRLLSEEIYSTLRQAIIEERLPPGMKIVEERLANELGVSRIPLREALHKLERDGFVESLAHRGFRVTAFDKTDIEEIYAIRILLEVPAAGRACGRMNESALNLMGQALQGMRDATEAGDTMAVVGHHIRFHRAIYDSGDNKRLANLLGPFLELGFTVGVARETGENGWESFLKDHADLFAALKDGDVAIVERTMADHLERGREIALRVATN